MTEQLGNDNGCSQDQTAKASRARGAAGGKGGLGRRKGRKGSNSPARQQMVGRRRLADDGPICVIA
jgi:hypothetical protein